jgi:hypothetical protein
MSVAPLPLQVQIQEHVTVNPTASDGGALQPLLMPVLTLACVVMLGRVSSVCYFTYVIWCCCGCGGSSTDVALIPAPLLIMFISNRQGEAFFLGRGKGGKGGIGPKLCWAWRKRMRFYGLNRFLTDSKFFGRKGLLPGRDWPK